jgi:DNA-binding transcriptional LysR family regulator
MMHISHLRALVAVAEFRSFGEAALALGLSQSAISHGIATLEESLGVILFTRGRHGAVLTPAGTCILRHAQETLHHLELMEQEAHRHRGLEGGEVRISSFRSVATHILPEAIARFQALHPQVRITLQEQPHYLAVDQSLREGQTDLGFTHGSGSEELESVPLLADEYIALFPPRAILPIAIAWEDLDRHGLLLTPCLPCGTAFQKHLRDQAPQLCGNSSIQEDSTIVGMVQRGLGCAIMPRLAAEPLPPVIPWRRLPVPFYRELVMARLASALHPPAAYAFWELLQAMVPLNLPVLASEDGLMGLA